jgi:hypothetical protein
MRLFMLLNNKTFTDYESNKLIKQVDVRTSLFSGTTIGFEINSQESRTLVCQQLRQAGIFIEPSTEPNQISIHATELYAPKVISKALDLLVAKGHLSTSLCSRIKANYLDAHGGTMQLKKPSNTRPIRHARTDFLALEIRSGIDENPFRLFPHKQLKGSAGTYWYRIYPSVMLVVTDYGTEHEKFERQTWYSMFSDAPAAFQGLKSWSADEEEIALLKREISAYERQNNESNKRSLKASNAPVACSVPSLMSHLISEDALLKQLEDKFLEAHRHEDPKLQYEYDKRHGLILYEGNPIRASALLGQFSAFFQSPEKPSPALEEDEAFVLIENNDIRTTDPVGRGNPETLCVTM